MKLSLLTYNMAKTWELPKVIQMARAGGFAGVEFRTDSNHKHGVELETTPEQRRAIRESIEDGYLEVACLGLSSRFDTTDVRPPPGDRRPHQTLRRSCRRPQLPPSARLRQRHAQGRPRRRRTARP